MASPALPSPAARIAIARAGLAAGLVVLAFTVYWAAFPLQPAEPLGAKFGGNAVLALELAREPGDITRLIGAPESGVAAALDRVNSLDYGYLLAYGTLLAAGFVGLAGRLADRRFLLGVALVALAVTADALENVALLSITKANADVAGLLPRLRVATLVKWEVLALISAWLGVGFVREGGWPRRAAGAFSILAAPLGALTAWDGATFSPLLTLAFAPAWTLVLVSCARDARPAPPRHGTGGGPPPTALSEAG